MGDLFYYNIYIGYNRLLGIVHRLMSRSIKDAMFNSFKCIINFHRIQNVLIRRPSSAVKIRTRLMNQSMHGREKEQITLSTILCSSWERGRGNMIFSEDLAVDVN